MLDECDGVHQVRVDRDCHKVERKVKNFMASFLTGWAVHMA
jgi:hypothetical protein